MDHSKPHTHLYNLPFSAAEFNGMPYRKLGLSGLKVSNIGLGTWKMGYPDTGDGSRTDEKASLALLDRAAELGVTFWDTANRYNNSSGNSERIIGTWFKNNQDQRRNIILCTKMAGLMDGTTPNHCSLSRINIMESVYASLERLQTDYIDLFYFHVHDSITPPDESLAAVEDLVRQDLIRYFAVSNFTVEQLEVYKDMARRISPRCRALAVQNQFDVLDGETEAFQGVLDYSAKNDLSFIAWSPMARGLLSNRYLDPAKAAAGDRLFDEGLLESRISEGVLEKLRALNDLADSAGIELSQLVIAYMLTLPGMGPVIATSSNVQQLESNAQAGKITLENGVIEKVRSILK